MTDQSTVLRVRRKAVMPPGHGKITPDKRAAMFWAKIDKNGPNGCWEWQGYCYKDRGYTKFNGKTRQVYRVAWELLGLPVPPGLWCLHHCDNGKCVNPDHLFWGTPKDNMLDMVRKRRNHPPQVKLHESDIPAIRTAVAAGQSQSSVGRAYGMTQQTISCIAKRKIWKHVL
jgi:hypothetical protein